MDKRLQRFDALCFQLTCEQLAISVILRNLCIVLIVVVEESKVLIGNIHIWVSTQPSMFLLRYLSTAKRMPVDLGLYLFRRIRHKYCAILVRRAHLGSSALQSWEELGVQECWFGIPKPVCYVAREAEVWVLVDCTRNERWNVFLGAKYMWVGVGERGSSLNGREVDFADVVAKEIGAFVSECDRGRRDLPINKAKRCSSLADCDSTRYSDYILVKGAAVRTMLARPTTLGLQTGSPNIIKVAEYESLFSVETDGNNILRILPRKLLHLLNLEITFEQELLII